MFDPELTVVVPDDASALEPDRQIYLREQRAGTVAGLRDHVSWPTGERFTAAALAGGLLLVSVLFLVLAR